MKTLFKSTFAFIFTALFAGAAIAGPFGLPDHQPNGYRDTGCDPAFQVVIRNDEGKALYSNNPTCPTPIDNPKKSQSDGVKGDGVPA